MSSRDTYHHGDLAQSVRAEALRLVRAEGAHSFSLRAAARAVGVDVAAVYRHYRDKQALLRAVAQLGFLQLGAAMHAERAAATSAEQRFRGVGRAYVGFAVQEPELFRLMFGPWGAGGDAPVFDDGSSVAFEALLASLEDLRAAGACAPPLQDAATVAWSAVHGLATLLVDGPLAGEDAGPRMEVVFDVVLRGLAAPTRAEVPAP
jgi:AcrR family transcriptional regulator